MKAKTNHKTGLAAENFAAMILRLKGYRILETRFKTPVGEIDLIAKRGKTVAFIEVKARGDIGNALAAVTPQMKSRITRAAHYYMAAHPEIAQHTLRFDLIAIKSPFFWRHLYNAWLVDS